MLSTRSFFVKYSLTDESIILPDNKTNCNSYNSFKNLQTCIIGDIVLDNKEELLQNLLPELRANINEPKNANAIVLAYYKKWGSRCTEKLLGNFAFIIWDSESKILLCGRDHLGLKPLFYSHSAETILISNDLNLLVSKKGNPSVNANKIAAMVFPNTLHSFRHQTWFEGVFVFPAGTNFIINQKGIRKEEYWTPTIGNKLTFKNDSDFTEAFQDKIFAAVRNRFNNESPVSALLSGGLDSSAIVSVAAKILENQNKELQTFSAVLPNPNDPVFKDEKFYIDQCKSFPNVKINYITAPEKGFFDILKLDNSNILAPNITSRNYLYDAFSSRALELGSTVILEGAAGELGPTWHGDGAYAELFVTGKWSQLGKELKNRKELINEHLLYGIAKNVFKPIFNQYFQNRNKDLLQITDDHCLQKEYVEYLRNHITTKSIENSIQVPIITTNQRQNHVNIIKATQRKAQYRPIITETEYLYPFKDKNLIEFCINLPIEYKIRDGYTRYTIRKGLENILPPKIQWRNTKTPFSPDYMRRYINQVPLVLDFLENIQSNDPIRTIIDISKLKKWLQIPIKESEKGTFAEKVAMHLVPQTIYLIHFLRRFDNFKLK
jgi:asparagine synthase (glutamine-hydrolysing)